MKKYDIQHTEILPLPDSNILKIEQKEKKQEEQSDYIFLKREEYKEQQERDRNLLLSIFKEPIKDE